VNLVETYIQLDDAAQEEYQALLADKEHEEVATMELTWAGKIAHDARQEAREIALQEGLQKGREEGREEGKRDLLLDLLEHRFGRLPKATVNRVNALTSSEELSRLAARVLDAPTLEDLGL
jgi:flagellar biosynthesis/type III secretory pathway protein FliH